jgi:hypothetical protein
VRSRGSGCRSRRRFGWCFRCWVGRCPRRRRPGGMGVSVPAVLSWRNRFLDAWRQSLTDWVPVGRSRNGGSAEEWRLRLDDAEGVDIYYGHGATGYVIVSSQGDDRYAVYSMTGHNRSLGTFLVRGVGVDDINGSDGLAVTNRPVGRYRQGLLVSHDDTRAAPVSTRTATPPTSPSSTGETWRTRSTCRSAPTAATTHASAESPAVVRVHTLWLPTCRVARWPTRDSQRELVPCWCGGRRRSAPMSLRP